MSNYLFEQIESSRDIHDPQEELGLFYEDCVKHKNIKIEK